MYKKPNPITRPCRADDEDDCPVKLKYDIESEEFYELMQAYRCAPFQNQDAVCEYYADVKAYISKFVEKQIEQAKTKDWREAMFRPGPADSFLPDDHPLMRTDWGVRGPDDGELPAKSTKE